MCSVGHLLLLRVPCPSKICLWSMAWTVQPITLPTNLTWYFSLFSMILIFFVQIEAEQHCLSVGDAKNIFWPFFVDQIFLSESSYLFPESSSSLVGLYLVSKPRSCWVVERHERNTDIKPIPSFETLRNLKGWCYRQHNHRCDQIRRFIGLWATF